MVLLDPMSAVFAETAKGKQAINMALLPVTESGQPGYEVERVEAAGGWGNNAGGNILHLRIRGRKVKVWSRKSVDVLLKTGFSVERQSKKGRALQLVIFSKRPIPGKNGVFHVEATLRSAPKAQLSLLSTVAAQQEEPPAAEAAATPEEEMEQRLGYLLHGKAEPAQPAVVEELDDEMPEYREVQVAPGKEAQQLFWRGAPYANEAELKLGQALDRINGAMPTGTGLTHIPNGALVLKACRRLHRKPDFIVILAEEGYQVMGVVEVDGSAHNGRHLGDEQKQNELEDNGIVQIKRISAEAALADADGAAGRVLSWLRQIRRTGVSVNGAQESDF